MPNPSAPRFTPQNQTTHERLSTNTVGLVALSDFRKRRAEVLEQQEREARVAALATNSSTPDRSRTATPNVTSDSYNSEAADRGAKKLKKKKKQQSKALVSFAGEDEGGTDTGGEDDGLRAAITETDTRSCREKESLQRNGADGDDTGGGAGKSTRKLAVNASVGLVPRVLTKAALRREASEREALRREFLALQAAVKASEIAIPFVFYDGTNVPGGVVRVRKGDYIWVFLDKSRKVGAQLGVGGDRSANVRRAWARVGVDDLMLVRGSIIIPHHYEFYFFIINKTIGPAGRRLFDYKAEAPPVRDAEGSPDTASVDPLSPQARGVSRSLTDMSTLEGATDDPTFTKVVDRRWYERNKHIYPASAWQEFDPEKDYRGEIRRDQGGNALFFGR